MEPDAYQSMYQVEQLHWWYRSRRKIVARLIKHLVPVVDGRILDTGCGTGGNLGLLSGIGDTLGLEYNPDAAQLSKQRNICPVIRAKLPDGLPFPAASCAMVTLFDVLEHIDDDKATLTSLHSVLRPQGHIVITVPAFPFLWSYHDTTHHHKRRYTRRSLEKILRESGFTIEYLSYYNFFLFPLVLVMRLIGNLTGASAGSDETIPAGPLNVLLEKIFAAERYLMPSIHFPFGISLIAVARKHA